MLDRVYLRSSTPVAGNIVQRSVCMCAGGLSWAYLDSEPERQLTLVNADGCCGRSRWGLSSRHLSSRQSVPRRCSTISATSSPLEEAGYISHLLTYLPTRYPGIVLVHRSGLDAGPAERPSCQPTDVLCVRCRASMASKMQEQGSFWHCINTPRPRPVTMF